ncbi:variant surface glycoprotein (VSG, atypical), putative [Trypanosoma equiperdum]|uniref:Variant surface glycoprotein (VSG, atypical), putative n=1 Tax=Trypanosoma equiperdum TaxID=5694 RepID=A0A1G4HZN5_TRYEQ|nr:variant surface glycoprotein (VSG, atypical), putative [Trypanosoma equiperdum]
MYKGRSEVVLLLILTTRINFANAAAGEAKNIREFHILCNLVELCKKAPTNLAGSSLTDAAVQAIELINMSASTDEWQNQFPTLPNDGAEANQGCDKQPKPISCHENYEKWRTARTQLEQPANKEIKQTPAKGIQNTAYGRRVQTQIAAIAIEAQGIYVTYSKNTAPTLDDINNKLKVHFENALYGVQTRPLNGAAVDKWQASGTRTDDCKASKAGISLRGDLMCLCAQDDSLSQTMCGPSVTAAGGNWQTNTIAGQVNSMVSRCQSKAKPDVSSAYIRKALNDFTAALKSRAGSGADNVLLGTGHTNGNCGGQANVACVDYTQALVPKEDRRLNDIKWYTELDDAAEALDNYTAAMAEEKAAQTKIHKLKQEAERLFQTLKVQDPAAIQPISQLPRIDPLESKKKCEQFHNKSKECTENGCKWNGKTETAGTTGKEGTAGTNEGATATGCEKHFTDENGCKKMNEGKDKPVCGWKKGGEGDKDKDELRCRSSSFLVTNKFALSVVSAAFVALLF